MPKGTAKGPAKKPAKAKSAPTAKEAARRVPKEAKPAAAPPAPAPAPAPVPTPPPRPVVPAAPARPVPEFVRKATAAERKAALERLAEEEVPRVFPRPQPTPEFVRRASAAERKAAVEALARQEADSFLGGVPVPAWKKKAEAGGATPAAGARSGGAKPTRLPAAAKPAAPAVGSSPKRVIILDTNALMMQFQFHVNIEGELRRILDFAYEIIVPDCVMIELEELVKVTTGKDQQEARMALELAKSYKQMEAPAEGDAGILRLAEKLNAIVVTNDKLLRARLRAKDIANIHLRSRAFLTLEGHIPGM